MATQRGRTRYDPRRRWCGSGSRRRGSSLDGSAFTSTSLRIGSSATETMEVWRRPRRSVGGQRCTQCFPDSCRNASQAPAPSNLPSTWPFDELSKVTWRFFDSAYLQYAANSSATKSFESSPPSPNWISTTRSDEPEWLKILSCSLQPCARARSKTPP